MDLFYGDHAYYKRSEFFYCTNWALYTPALREKTSVEVLEISQQDVRQYCCHKPFLLIQGEHLGSFARCFCFIAGIPFFVWILVAVGVVALIALAFWAYSSTTKPSAAQPQVHIFHVELDTARNQTLASVIKRLRVKNAYAGGKDTKLLLIEKHAFCKMQTTRGSIL